MQRLSVTTIFMLQNIFSLINRHKVTFVILTVLTLLLVVVQAARAEDRRIVTVYYEGQELVVPTTAKTVGEVLGRMGINVYDNDLVEPGIDDEITSDSFNINVYRARPVTVIDGSKKYIVNSPYQSSRRIAESAGLKIYDEDTFTQERITDFIAEGALGLKMIITRAKVLTVNLYGSDVEVRTQAKTVGDMLDEKGIKLIKGDSVKPAKSATIAGISKIFVTRTGIEIVTKVEEVEFSEETIKDTGQDIGYRKIKTPGVLGSKTVTYEVTKENGKEVKRRTVQSVVTKEPKVQVVIVGAKSPAPPVSNIGGSKQDWMTAAGIPQDQWVYVDYIVSRESGWNPNAVNPYSGACGLAQALPCSKVGAGATNPIVALQWQYGYVNARYGGYAGAYDFWVTNHWY